MIAFQNVTWYGLQGFQEYPGEGIYIPYHTEYNSGALAGAGIVGTHGTERGLTYFQVQLAGHELPEYTPEAGYRTIELMLGRLSSLSDMSDFIMQTGNYTGKSTIYKRMQEPNAEYGTFYGHSLEER